MKPVVDIDVVIPTFGRPAVVNQTLRMLLDQEALPRRVIVVNQTPGIDAAEPDVRRSYLDIGMDMFWINRDMPSLCGARNDALRAATSAICLFLDDDIVPPKDLVRKHWERYHDGAGWEAVGGQVMHRRSDYDAGMMSLDAPEVGTTPALQSAEPIPGGPLFGGHFSLYRETALAVGGWDEAFIGSANWEEGDLMHRLQAHKTPFVWDPHIWMIHLRLPMGGCRIPGNTLFPEWTKSTNFFLYKYRYPADKPWKEVLSSALRAGPLRREIVVCPWRWPVAWLGFVRGWLQGKTSACNPIMPLLGPRTDTGKPQSGFKRRSGSSH